MRKRLAVLMSVAVLSFVAACNRTSPERQAILDAADAMGGRDKLAAIKTLTIQGEGDAPNVGQNTMPDSELPNWKVTELKRTIDLKNHRMRVEQLRTAQFLFANANTQRQSQGLDGNIAFNVGAEDTRASVNEKVLFTALKVRLIL